jgi:Recombination endonuclease VII
MNDEWERTQASLWRSALKCKYGLTENDFANILEEQDHKCAICERPRIKPRVDHCHASEAEGFKHVRALLCQRCNQGLGMFQDSPTLLRKAIEYLEANAGPVSVA